MLKRFNDVVMGATEAGLWIGFGALIITVGLQVTARNVLGLPFIWTLDLAQLLFSWIVFIGAAVAYRRGAHYTVDIWPENSPRLDFALRIVGLVAAAIVIYVLVLHGWTLTRIRWTGTVESLGISRGWMFIPIPLGGALMLLFLIEALWDTARPQKA
ncbi:TRAP transporter small permease [Mesorhizobium sp. CAU 1741]|uniref:TRAP transporter small permease n=1 Tax=Mesorhizobium sp. CAU 1741 TaxID=3140366 RepID=UPI00325A5AEC